MGLMFPIVLFVLIFYFLIFRPQKKKQQQHEKMVASIGRGDTVVTAGGFFGRVSDVLDDSYIIEIADGVKVRILKSSISLRREPGEGKPKTDRTDRPKKRRRRVEGTEATGETAAIAEGALEDGLTEAENTALLDQEGEAGASPDTVAVDAEQATTESKEG